MTNRTRTQERTVMAIALPQSVKKILQDKAYGHVVTLNADGKPQPTMVWMDVEGDEVLFNTADGRLKPKNLRRDPRVIISVQDHNDPQSYMVFHGQASVTEAGADEHIDTLAKRFL
ncbi:MAG: TIGR03618 family F420-dependent PPOX class oxidoreductase, partial [candidate division NC10 bacterium]